LTIFRFQVIMYRTMKDLIMPKLVYTDLPLFMSLLSDLFPGVEIAAVDGGALRRALEEELLAAGLQVVPAFVTKIIQVRQPLRRCEWPPGLA
jgi:dynein heavy chain